MYDVICYGTICQDRIIRVPRYPSCGSSVWIQEDRLTVGGEAANSALAFDAWGVKTLLLGTVLGNDDQSAWLVDRLQALENVDSSHLTRSDDSRTPYCLILATPDGERTMFGRHFDLMRGQELRALPPAHVFTVDPYCGPHAVQATQEARRAGMFIIAMDALEYPDLAAAANWIVTSRQEVAPQASLAEIEQIGCEAARRHGKTLILTMGDEGSLAFDEHGDPVHRQHAVRVTEVVDATGCGDVYRAGLACGKVHGWPLPKCMAFASAAAALNLLGLGGGGKVANLEDTLQASAKGIIG